MKKKALTLAALLLAPLAALHYLMRCCTFTGSIKTHCFCKVGPAAFCKTDAQAAASALAEGF